MLLFFRDKNPFSQPSFSRKELNLILSVYGERVQRGEWRDYAIDSLPDMAVFSIYRSSNEKPIYVVAKIPGKSLLKAAQYAVYAGNQTLRRGASLQDVLKVFATDKAEKITTHDRDKT